MRVGTVKLYCHVSHFGCTRNQTNDRTLFLSKYKAVYDNAVKTLHMSEMLFTFLYVDLISCGTGYWIMRYLLFSTYTIQLKYFWFSQDFEIINIFTTSVALGFWDQCQVQLFIQFIHYSSKAWNSPPEPVISVMKSQVTKLTSLID